MTELSHPEESAAAQSFPDWPEISAEVQDHLVQEVLARLAQVPGTPLARHEAAYNDLHDELRSALDSDPVGQSASGGGTPERGA